MAGELLPPPQAKGFNVSPLGPIDIGHRADRSRFADIFKNGYQWTKKQLPTPGTGNFAFDTLGLAEFSPIGTGIVAWDNPPLLQPPQVYFAGQMVVTNGFGGLVPGQIINQPLLDPYSGTVGGV